MGNLIKLLLVGACLFIAIAMGVWDGEATENVRKTKAAKETKAFVSEWLTPLSDGGK